jgi:hypothetical protein
MRRTKAWLLAAAVGMGAAPAGAEGHAAHVASVDFKARCLAIEWNNDTEKTVCWTDTTRFSVLETKRPARATDVRKGSYLRIEGEERDGTFRASEIVIWEEASRPAE